MTIQPKIALELYEQVIQKFKEYYRIKHDLDPTVSQIFGLKGYQEEQATLESHMESIPKVQEYISSQGVRINPRYLYDKKNQIDKQNKNGQGEKNVRMLEPYDRLFFLYLGYENLEDYLKNGLTPIV